MDNRFPPPDGPNGRPNGPDLRKNPERGEFGSQPSDDPYLNDNDGRTYEERMNPPFSPYDEFQRDDREFGKLKHSGPGIASFVLSLVAIALYVVFFVSAVGVVYSIGSAGTTFDPYTATEEQMMSVGVGALVLIASLLGAAVLNLIGVILGIVGLVSKTRKKVFAVIGTALNALCLLGGGGFILISTLMGAGGL